ncbi:helix-turn-helix domain-containing protein [Paracoccus sp. KR1-242]|uniref:helix-turn-helix domain-containing protein n=1 Tax=Paracoccus sp. KR1-242 TaxID=3410028 RepID=UPI003BFA8744
MSKTIYDREYRQLIDALRSERRAVGLTQQELADRLGRPQSFVAKVEGYERRLDIVEFVQVCRALRLDPATVFAYLNETG